MEVVLGKGSASSKVPAPCGEVASSLSEGDSGGKDGSFVGQQVQAPARRVKKRTLVEVLEQCRQALELLKDADVEELGDTSACAGEGEEEDSSLQGSSSSSVDSEADELNSLLKSRVDSPKFLEKLDNLQKSISLNVSATNADEGTTWDVITAKDLWDDKYSEVAHGCSGDDDDYVVVKQEDIVDGIACFMAAYLLSLKETKELTPNQLQEALSKTFSLRKRKGKFRKAWDGGKVIYNVASWSATAIGIYQNPALFRAASVAFWTSCQTLSKLF